MTTEELDLAVDLIIQAHGQTLDRSTFENVARNLTPTLGVRDRMWARYLLAVRGGRRSS
jgi:hypothetical protein